MFPTYPTSFLLRWQKNSNNAVDVPDINLQSVCTYDDVDYENKLTKAFIARNVDGLFIVPSTLENQQHHLRKIRKPMVLLDRDFKYTDNALVESNNISGGEKLTQNILRPGRLQYGFCWEMPVCRVSAIV
ncbi:ybl117 [Escherichia coli]|uniref:Ybl117 n=1 Tax=Escherichia coli TaxID=562 RepID=A0A377CWF8_ECOLX|nr:ybl117 [Escherichia coli]